MCPSSLVFFLFQSTVVRELDKAFSILQANGFSTKIAMYPDFVIDEYVRVGLPPIRKYLRSIFNRSDTVEDTLQNQPFVRIENSHSVRLLIIAILLISVCLFGLETFCAASKRITKKLLDFNEQFGYLIKRYYSSRHLGKVENC